MMHQMHPSNKALIAKLSRLGYFRKENRERTPSELVYDKGTARVWFEDFEGNYVTVMRMDRHGVPEWKVTLVDAPAKLVDEAIKAAERPPGTYQSGSLGDVTIPED